jgi:hypothetical protein
MAKYRVVLELDTSQSYKEIHRAVVEAEITIYDYLLASKDWQPESLKSNSSNELVRENVGIISIEEIK